MQDIIFYFLTHSLEFYLHIAVNFVDNFNCSSSFWFTSFIQSVERFI